MASLDSVSIAIFLGAVLVMAGILSSLLALRFGAPLLLVLLLIGMLAADAAAVSLLFHTQGLRLRPRVGATLEAESGTKDPFSIFLTLMLVEFISLGESSPLHVALELAREGVLGAVIGVICGRLVVVALNRMALPQGLHAPFVATAALVIFGVSQLS